MENIKNQTKLKNITEIKKSLEGFNGRLDGKEEKIRKLEEIVKIIQAEKRKKRFKKK